jgi:hypothetical protein
MIGGPNDLPGSEDLSLKIWRYLADRGECRSKRDTPYWYEIQDCPLCTVFATCIDGCPLQKCGAKSLYGLWMGAKDAIYRAEAARRILERIEAWEPEEQE